MLGERDRPEFGVEMLSEEVRRFLRLERKGSSEKILRLLQLRERINMLQAFTDASDWSYDSYDIHFPLLFLFLFYMYIGIYK